MSLDYPGLASDIAVDLGAANVPAGNDELSITGWVNPDLDGTAEDQVIISKSNTTGNAGAFKMQLETPSNFLRGIINGDEITGSIAVAPGAWAFLAMIYDGVNKAIFVNSVLDATEPQTGNVVTSADPFKLGAVDTGTNRREFDGLLADIRVYTRALSLAELQTIFILLGKDNIVFGLQWRWMQRELSPGTAATIASSIKDFASNQNGTPENSPIYQAGILR